MESPCQQVQLWFSDLLDGGLTPDDAAQFNQHLVACQECREQCRLSARLHRALAELSGKVILGELQANIQAALRTDQVDPTWTPTNARPPRRRIARRWVVMSAVAASVLVLIGIGWSLWGGRIQPLPIAASTPMARLDLVSGEVYRLDGASRALVKSGQELLKGDGVQTIGEDSSATVVFADGTRVEIGPDSLVESFAEHRDSGKRVALAEGFLVAEVTRQPADRPMVLVTQHASIEAKDTRLQLISLTTETRLEVEDGAVDVKPCGDVPAFRVDAGAGSVVGSARTPQRLSQTKRFTQPRLSLPNGPGRVLALAFAAQGEVLAAGSKDGYVRLWDLALGADQVPRIIQAQPSEEVRSLVVSPDGKILAVGGDARYQLKLFDATTAQEIATLATHRSWIETMAFTPDSQTLIIAGAHGPESSRIYFWNVAARKPMGFVDGHASGVWSVVLASDGKTLATGGRDGTIKLWDVHTRQLLKTIAAHQQEVNALAFAPNGRTLLSGSKDRTARLWDLATGEARYTLAGHAYTVRGVAFAPDGGTVATTSQDGCVKIWNVDDGQELRSLRMPLGAGGWAVAFSPDGTHLVSSGGSNFVKVWERVK